MKKIHSLSEIIDQYDGFIIDLWGVMHDGTALYPTAKAALKAIHEAGKEVVFLSNAPRQAKKAAHGLDNFGVPRDQYKKVITSGQVAHDTLRALAQEREKKGSQQATRSPKGEAPRCALASLASAQKYYYLGPSKDEDVIADLDYQKVALEEADFVLCAGFEVDFQPLDEIRPTLEKIAARNIPVLCINPDLEVVKQDGTHMYCAGWVAAELEKLGVQLIYFGKPHADVYDVARKVLGSKNPLAIGDNLLTDIKGANAQAIDSLLITGGVIYTINKGHPSHEQLQKLGEEAGASPSYYSELFSC